MIVFAGLDCETSGTDSSKHEMIQIGVAVTKEDTFGSKIGWPECEYEPEALEAIGVRPAELRHGPPAKEVDSQLASWLGDIGLDKGSLVPVGWGVSSFDLPFVRKTLPQTMQFLSRHTVELNAVCYTLGYSKRYLEKQHSSVVWKHMAKRAAERALLLSRGIETKWHDAEFDAAAALASWLWLRRIVADPSPAPILSTPPFEQNGPTEVAP